MKHRSLICRRVAVAVGTSLFLLAAFIGGMTAALDPANGFGQTVLAPAPASTAEDNKRLEQGSAVADPPSLGLGLDSHPGVERSQGFALPADPSASQRVSFLTGDAAKEPLSGTEAERTVRRAWELVREAGAYRFDTDLAQTTYPARLVANAGRGPRQEAAYLEGKVDVPARTMSLRLWQGAGNVQGTANSAELRLEGDHAYLRGPGGAWQETEDFSGSFAPGSDPLGYLAALKNVKQAPAAPSSSSSRTETPLDEQGTDPSRFTLHAARFTFDLDGPAFARYLRDELERQLREKGELPANVHLDTAAEYRDIIGKGEIWIDVQGLPLRLVMHLIYPEQQNGAHVEAEIKTDFSGFPAQGVAPSLLKDPGAWTSAALRSSAGVLGLDARTAGDWGKAAGRGGILLGSLGFVALLVWSRRSRRLYAAVVLAMIFSMVVIPLLQNQRAAAFFDRQTARQAQQAQAEQAAQAKLAEQAAPAWDPHQDPLAAAPPAEPAQAVAPAGGPQVEATSTPVPGDPCADYDANTDYDGDGLNDHEECVIGTNYKVADTDKDGLTDGPEVNRLGTAPTLWDSDGDQITDTVEIEGFRYPESGDLWYLNPTSPDSNRDGQLDSLECAPLLKKGGVPTQAECDADADGTPNPFDDDNDNDGVPDLVDLSPNDVLDRNGLAHNGGDPALANPYNREHPFPLLVTSLNTGYPTLVDLQVQPLNLTHLTYALNVLDWPTGDDEGQIQHVKDTTFATSDSPDARQEDDVSGQNGDMRLVPIMEIEMTGSSVPLKLTAATATMTVTGELTGTVMLTSAAADHTKSDLAFTFLPGTGAYEVKIYAGECPETGSVLATFSNVSSGSRVTYTPPASERKYVTGLADANHALVLSQGQKSACAEIPNIVNGPYDDKMVDQSVLEPYGIGVLEEDEQANGSRTLLAYVPLNLAPAASGGGRTAFQARMLYWPEGKDNAWTQAQQVRVLWAVQMLTDACDQTGFPLDQEDQKDDPDNYDEQLKTWCATNRTIDNLQVVQTYDESWRVTGLNVREDHGLDVAIAYLNPSTYQDPNNYPVDEQNLWQLSWGLGQMFLPGRDCQSDASLVSGDLDVCTYTDTHRDVAVFESDSENPAVRIGNTTIAGRFDGRDSDGDGTLNDEEYAIAKGWTDADRLNTFRWDIPADALFVETLRYPDQDYLSYMAATEVPRILGQYPTNDPAFDPTPTLLYAREERYRSAGLAAAVLDEGVLKVDANAKDHPEETLAGLVWAPYRYNRDTDPVTGQVVGWEAYPADEYYNVLGDSLLLRFDTNFPEDVGSTNEGRVTVARGYYITLLSGMSVQVQPCSGGGCEEAEGESDAWIEGTETVSDKIADVSGDIALEAMKAFRVLKSNALASWWEAESWGWGDQWDEWHVSTAILESIGEAAKDFFVSPWKSLFQGSDLAFMAGVGIVAAAIATIGLTLIFGANASGGDLATRIMLDATFAIATLALIKTFANTVKEVGRTGVSKFMQDALHELSKNLRANMPGWVVKMAISVAITWAAFALQLGLGHLAIDSMAFANAFAGAVVASINTILFYVVMTALGPLGEILWSAVMWIDALVSIICNALPQDMQEGRAGQWLCGGISGLVSKAIKWAIYSDTIMVDLDDASRLQTSYFNMVLSKPEDGLVANNSAQYQLTVTNTIKLVDVPISPAEAAWFWEFNDDVLTGATFKYRLQDGKHDFDGDLRLYEMSSTWKKVPNGDRFYFAPTVTSDSLPLPAAGINQPATLFLSEAYDVPRQECWGYFWIAACLIVDERDTSHTDLSDQLVFDVLPATLDAFYTLAPAGNGYALGWSQHGGLSFPVLQDADGDGVSFVEDLQDNVWDRDGDGLSDGYETQAGSNPDDSDSDGDGLDDQQEAVLGTNPLSEDSDGDGLGDNAEHDGWKIIRGYDSTGAAQYTWVWPDPLSVDADGDELTDDQEKIYGYHPQVPSNPNVLALSSKLRETASAGAVGPSRPDDVLAPWDGFVKPGDRLHYTATVGNNLDERTAQGLLSTEAPEILVDEDRPPGSFVLQPLHEQTISGTLVVQETAASGVYSLTQAAGALITDWQALAGDAKLWLRFDEAAGAMVYADSSGQIPPHDGQCTRVGGCSSDPSGRFGAALLLNRTGHVTSTVQVAATASGVSLWFKTNEYNPGNPFFVISDQSWLLEIMIEPQDIFASMRGPVGVEQIRADGSFNDGKWHHLVHTFGGSAGGQKLYVDGVLRAGGNLSAMSNAHSPGVWIGDSYQGSIDDVRLFDKGLTQADVAALFNEPVLHVDFDAATFPDVSPFGNAVSCTSPYCPAQKTGIAGSAGDFGGSAYLSSGANPVLDLSHTPFTLAAWVYPETYGNSDPRDSYLQGILGQRSSEANGAPSLQRKGNRIYFGMGTNAGWKSWPPDGQGIVVRENAWNHVAVAVSFDSIPVPNSGHIRFYVDGVYQTQEDFANLTLTASAKRFDIGRSTNLGKLDFNKLESDYLYGVNEYCQNKTQKLVMKLQEPGGYYTLFDQNVTCRDPSEPYPIDKLRTVTETATLLMTEDGKTVELYYDGALYANETFDFTRVGEGSSTQPVKQAYKTSGGSDLGSIFFTYASQAVPFKGKLDEVAIYTQALDATAIQKLASPMALYLPLDEPPGSATFQNMGLEGNQAACTWDSASATNHCPTTGVTGRINQAAWFANVSGETDYLTFPNSAINRTTNSLAVVAWINPQTLQDRSYILATAQTHSGNGFGFGTKGDELLFKSFGGQDYVSTGASLQTDHWYQVAAVVDEQNHLTFYVNNAPKGAAQTVAVTPDADDLLQVGATTDAGSNAPQYPFDGEIDDLRVYRQALLAADIGAIYNQAPVLHLLFDDSRGVTHFKDNAGGSDATCADSPQPPGADSRCLLADSHCPCTGEGIAGQLGLAADFDGTNDLVSVAGSSLQLGAFTIGAWVKPDSVGVLPNPQTLIRRQEPYSNLSFELDIAANSLTPSLYASCHGQFQSFNANQSLIQNHWSHVMATFDGSTLTIYVNGSPSGSKPFSAASCTGIGNLEIGNWGGSASGHSFAGQMDEVAIYGTALSAQQVQDIYTYQAGWVEDRQSYDVTVDADRPSVALKITNGSYLAKQPTLVTVTAGDETSDVATVQLITATSTVAAPRCADEGGVAAWCPTFKPRNEGRQTLTARATDRVGNDATSESLTVYVDDQPPQVTIHGATLQRLDAKAGIAQPNTWTVDLSGSALDPGVGGGVAGSGVPADGVQVTLRSPGETLVRGGPQVADLSPNGTWSLDYVIPDAEPASQYTVTVEAVDNVARLPGLSTDQVITHHTGSARTVVLVDAGAPAVQLDLGNLGGGQITTTTALAGAATDRPVPVEVTWTGGPEADQANLAIKCDNPLAAYTVYTAGAQTFSEGQTYTWQGSLHRGSACHVKLTSTAGSGDIEGTVQVCGTQVASWHSDWTGSHDVGFQVEAETCEPRQVLAGAVAGVGKVETGFRSVLPGSAFVNETPPAGEILHLPFEDAPDSVGNLSFRDISGVNSPGTCSGTGCPATGQAGHIGIAVRFDGKDDAVFFPPIPGQTNQLSIEAWIRPDAAPIGDGTFIAAKNMWQVARFGDGTVRWRFDNISPGWYWVNTGYVAPLDQWTHLVVVYDSDPGGAQAVKTYANGALVHTYTVSGIISSDNWISIGSWPLASEYFAGLMDEVRLFDRALSPEEVKALYSGSGPVLALDFEEPWATEDTVLTDSSGWQHDGTLHVGANDPGNRAVDGQVGARALHFDGVDDNVAVAEDPGLDLSAGQLSEVAWIYSEVTDDEYHGILGYDPGECTPQRYPSLLVYERDKIAISYGDGWDCNVLPTDQRLRAGTWNHVVATFDSEVGDYKLYVNGDEVYSNDSFMNLPPYATKQLTIAKVGSSYFKGTIDDVRIYPRVIPPEEVQDMYLAGWQRATFQGGAGVAASNWFTHTPAGLEGFYEVELRGTDVASHAQAVNERAALWRGAADTLEPRVTLKRRTVDPSTYQYTTVAQDFNLVEDSFASPCGPGTITTRVYNVSPWLLAATGEDTAHPSQLYQLVAQCNLPAGATEQATACDSFGNCRTVGVSLAGTGPEDAGAVLAAGPGVRHAPALPATGATPAAIGGIRFDTTVLTSTAYYEPRTIAVTGLVTGTPTLAHVEVTVDGATGPAVLGETAATPPYTTTWRYPWRLPGDDPLPDGSLYQAQATATDLAGNTATATAMLTADVLPPALVTLTLTANGVPVQPGDTVRTSPAELALAWTASADGSRLAPYRITWSWQQTTTVTAATHFQDPAGVLEDRFPAGEARRLSVALASRDHFGNERVQVFAPVTVDNPRTPDAIWPGTAGQIGQPQEPYSGWLDSGCTLLGADRRATAYRGSQQLYASWDARALRLAWTGATWGGSADLFIYLDTGPANTTQAFLPPGVAVTGTVVTLPAGLGADTLVWVQDAGTASLLHWDGSTWGGAQPLSESEFHFTPATWGGRTDLYLPFDLLGIAANAPLGLLAFATEEPEAGAGLQLWAVLPSVNLVNSLHVNPNAALAGEGKSLSLGHFYRWPALSSNACPNGTDGTAGGGFADSELQMTLSAVPSATAISGRGGGVFWVSNPLTAGGDLFAFLQHGFPPVNDGQEVIYTVHYRNIGSQLALGVWLRLAAVGPLRLLDNATLPLGDLAPGAEGSATFRAVVDRSLSDQQLAQVLALVYDAGHGTQGAPLEWLVAFQRADAGAPALTEMVIEGPARLVGPEQATLRGYAHDEAGLAEVEVAILSPSGNVSSITCPAPRPLEGKWSCPWDVTQSNGGVAPLDGQSFSLRMAATDTFGHRSEWSETKVVQVDARPPQVSLDLAASGIYTDRVVSSLGRLFGAAQDPAGIRAVRVCVDDACDDAELVVSRPVSATWSYEARAGAQDYVQHTVSVSASDRVGNQLVIPLAFDVWVDNVSPAITVTTAISQVRLGVGAGRGGSRSGITPPLLPSLAGTVSDGGPEVDVSLRVQAPDGTLSRHSAARDGAAWWYELSEDIPGRYALWVDTVDLAGNRNSVGPFAVEVSCLAATPVVAAVTAEPASIAPLSVTLSAEISNAGIQTLPAGLPVGFYARPGGALGIATTTQALEPGASETVSTLWTPWGSGLYAVSVVLNDASANEPLLARLCGALETFQAAISIDDVPVYGSWNLVSSATEPYVSDVEVVQRPIRDAYTVILGYDQELLSYQPGQPQNTLETMDASHGYWIKALPGPEPPPTSTRQMEVATLRVVGEPVAEDQVLALNEGWNLASYLPGVSLPVTAALRGIEGVYLAALGFEGTALSFYPDLDDSFNTLVRLGPTRGYWIRASQAVTLEYPVTTVTATMSMTAPPLSRPFVIRQAEDEAGVRPSFEWMNFYGRIKLPDGTAVPTGTIVLALDPRAVICGATVVVVPGDYGLLACYRDDPYTSEDEGAEPGDDIRLVISSDGVHPDGELIGTGMWSAFGRRQQVPPPLYYLPLMLVEGMPEYHHWYLPLLMKNWGEATGEAQPDAGLPVGVEPTRLYTETEPAGGAVPEATPVEADIPG